LQIRLPKIAWWTPALLMTGRATRPAPEGEADSLALSLALGE